MELKQRMNEPRKPRVEKPALVKIARKTGESMRDFSRRVDDAIPLPQVKGINNQKTMRNAKKHKKKAENLRAEYKQKLEAKQRRIEEMEAGQNEDHYFPGDDKDEDIWASVNARAKAPKFGEVADRPPTLHKPKQNWNVPKNVSPERRKELEEERNKIIEFYRKKRQTSLLEDDAA